LIRDRKEGKDRELVEKKWTRLEELVARNGEPSFIIISTAKNESINENNEAELERNLEEDVDMMTGSLRRSSKKRVEGMTPAQFLRKSDIPVDYEVLAEMLAHKSLEDISGSQSCGNLFRSTEGMNGLTKKAKSREHMGSSSDL
jgi:hypothetical protein